MCEQNKDCNKDCNKDTCTCDDSCPKKSKKIKKKRKDPLDAFIDKVSPLYMPLTEREIMEKQGHLKYPECDPEDCGSCRGRCKK